MVSGSGYSSVVKQINAADCGVRCMRGLLEKEQIVAVSSYYSTLNTVYDCLVGLKQFNNAFCISHSFSSIPVVLVKMPSVGLKINHA